MGTTSIRRRLITTRLLAVTLAAALIPAAAVVPPPSPVAADTVAERAVTSPGWGPWRGEMSISSIEAQLSGTTQVNRSGAGSYTNLALVASDPYQQGGNNRYRADVVVNYSENWRTPCDDGGAATVAKSWAYTGRSEDAAGSADGGPGYVGGHVVRLEDRDVDRVYLTAEFVSFNTSAQFTHCPPMPAGSEPSSGNALAFYDGLGGQAVTPLVDTDPDPARLVGTTSWGLANPPTSSPPYAYTAYEFTVTYDLRRDPIRAGCHTAYPSFDAWHPSHQESNGITDPMHRFAMDVSWCQGEDGVITDVEASASATTLRSPWLELVDPAVEVVFAMRDEWSRPKVVTSGDKVTATATLKSCQGIPIFVGGGGAAKAAAKRLKKLSVVMLNLSSEKHGHQSAKVRWAAKKAWKLLGAASKVLAKVGDGRVQEFFARQAVKTLVLGIGEIPKQVRTRLTKALAEAIAAAYSNDPAVRALLVERLTGVDIGMLIDAEYCADVWKPKIVQRLIPGAAGTFVDRGGDIDTWVVKPTAPLT